MIASVSGGYKLCLGVGRIDAVDFAESVNRGSKALRAGDPITAQTELTAAMDLAHGRPLEDLIDYAFAESESSRLLELQATAAEELADAAMAAEGGERLVIDRLWPLLLEHPFRERLRGAVMKALFRDGRAADALQVYDEGRRLLRDELGLDPSPLLRALQASILAQDPSLNAAHAPGEPSRDLLPFKPLTPMFGRDGDVQVVCTLARRQRLVTLVGPGGVGKTRLAVECAHAMALDPRWSVRWVDLQDQPSAEGILLPVATALGRTGAVLPAAELARSVAHEGPLLLVLDNVEHLLPPAVATIAELLGHSQNISIIATSRVALAVPGEQRHRLEGLSLADGAAANETPSGDALDMFLDHAGHISPPLERTSEVLAQVQRICVAVGGLPLAVQLAAARLSTMTLPQLVVGLEATPTAILSASNTSLPMRHRSLIETLSWSERLLAPSAQRLFAWLSVFKGGFTIEAAEAVCGGDDADNHLESVARLLDVLVEANLLKPDHAVQGRLGFVVAAAELAAQRLLERGEVQEATTRHVRYFSAAVAGRWDSMPATPRSVAEAEWYEREHHNIRAACEGALANGHDPELADLVTGSAGYWTGKGDWNTASSLLNEVLKVHMSASQQADVSFWLSCIAAETGSMTDRLAHLGRAYGAAQQAGDAQRQVILQAALAVAHASAGDFVMARVHHSEAINSLVPIDDPTTRTQVLVSSVGAIRQDPERARQQLLEGIECAERSGIDLALVLALNNLADLCAGEGLYDEAIHWATLGLRHEMARHDISTRGYLTATLGVALVLGEHWARARPAAVEAFRTGVAAGSKGLAGSAALLLACVAACAGNDDEAALLFGWHDIRLRGLGDALQGPELAAYQRFILPLQKRLATGRFEFLRDNGAMLTEAEMDEWILRGREPAALELLRSTTGTPGSDPIEV